MPKGTKVCPDCGAEHGCRKIKCDCGYQFIGKKDKQERAVDAKPKQCRHPLGEYMLSPGLWVFDIPKGMPKVHCPAPLSPGPISNQEAYAQATYNGLGECILAYIPPAKIADPKLRKKWAKAQKYMKEVWEYLTDETCFKKTTRARKPRTKTTASEPR